MELFPIPLRYQAKGSSHHPVLPWGSGQAFYMAG